MRHIMNFSGCRMISVLRTHCRDVISVSSSSHSLPQLCTKCRAIGATSFHTHSPLYKKKFRKPLVFPVNIGQVPKCVIYKGMKIKDIAQNTNSSSDEVIKAYSSIKVKKSQNLNMNTVLNNYKQIAQLIGILGYQPAEQKDDILMPQKDPKKDIVAQPPADEKDLVRRPPVVTIMGHVDHGKTSLLDYLRKSKIVDKEFGGITQHIGAFRVKVPSGEFITFLDTPGHAAFSSMRERGAQVTDIVVLVVAADDGIMDQTVESIKYARKAGVPVIVAINKIDKPGADVEITEKMLIQHEIQSEKYGGDTQVVPVSALEGTNMPELLEALVTQAEIMELKSDPSGKVEGRIIESKVDPRKGRIATVIIQRGTLRKGMIVIAGTAWTRVRGIFDEDGKMLEKALPSTPVEIIGWKDLPAAGDQLLEAASERAVTEAVEFRTTQKKEEIMLDDMLAIQDKQEVQRKTYLEKREKIRAKGYRRASGHEKPKESTEKLHPSLSIIIKGDVNGSLEAILNILSTYDSSNCDLDIVHYAVGNVSQSDVEKALTFDSTIYAFNVDVAPEAQKIADLSGVSIKMHNVIYRLFDELLEDLLERTPESVEDKVIGEAEVKKIFFVKDSKTKVQVAGCSCNDGTLFKKENFRVMRGDSEVFKGKLLQLKHLKQNVELIDAGMDCGLSLDDRNFEFQEGDIVQCIKTEIIPPSIAWDPGF